MRKKVVTSYVVVAFKETGDSRLGVSFTGDKGCSITFLGSYFQGYIYGQSHGPDRSCLHSKPCRKGRGICRPRNARYLSDDSETSDSEEHDSVPKRETAASIPNRVWKYVYDFLRSKSGTSKYYVYELKHVFPHPRKVKRELPDLTLSSEDVPEVGDLESIRYVKIDSIEGLSKLKDLDLPNLVKLSLGDSISFTEEVIGQLTPYSYCEIEVPSTTRNKSKVLETGTETLSLSECKGVEGYDGFRSYRYSMKSNLSRSLPILYLDMNGLGPKVTDVTIVDCSGLKIEVVAELKSGKYKSARTCL